jgi:hypothetical protein
LLAEPLRGQRSIRLFLRIKERRGVLLRKNLIILPFFFDINDMQGQNSCLSFNINDIYNY